MGEQILVVRTEELKKQVDFQGFYPIDQHTIDKIYDAVEVFPMDRDLAETDPDFKQLVAYSTIHCDDTWLTYVRGKDLGEARLHGNRSMGIGGHIDATDHANLFIDDFLKVAAFREIDEEITIKGEYQLHLAGLLNDDSNDVGKVHVGLVYVTEVCSERISKRERGITRLTFMNAAELESKSVEFETWSQYLISNLNKLTK
jgi:predicted NUDIX family phosphoesterase